MRIQTRLASNSGGEKSYLRINTLNQLMSSKWLRRNYMTSLGQKHPQRQEQSPQITNPATMEAHQAHQATRTRDLDPQDLVWEIKQKLRDLNNLIHKLKVTIKLSSNDLSEIVRGLTASR